MTSKPATTFGKRGRPAAVRTAASRPPAPSALEATESGLPLSVLAASLVERPADAETTTARGAAARAVPYSLRAGLLAGMVVALMQAGLVIVGAKTQSAALSGLASLAGVDAQDMVPLVIAGSVVDSAQATGFTVLTAHWILKRLAITDHIAYALGGAAAAGIYAAASLVLDFGGPAHGWPIELATGLGAGFFYRVFAGANDSARST